MTSCDSNHVKCQQGGMWEVHADPKECNQRELVDHTRGAYLGDPPLLGGWSPSPGSTPHPKE